jgi:ectoine hydroxylase-related dioxygenase (phytanoyl-CoA dioxygenase family)
MSMPQPTVQLTPEQIEFYHREGYLVLPSISTPEEIERMRKIYDRLFETRAGREEGNQFDLGGTDEEGKTAVLPQILNPTKYAPELAEGLFRANGLAIAKQLLGPEAAAGGEHAILKPARIGAETPWHQDEAYWGADFDYNSFSLWMPLQPATMENGCMQFIPKSHKGDIVPHRSINDDPRIHGLEMLQNPDPATAVPCPIPAGGCTIHHNRTMHYAGPNRSDIPRRAYIMIFKVPPVKRATPKDLYWNAKKQTPREERAKQAREATMKQTKS